MACDFVVLVRDESLYVGTRSIADVVLDALESVDAIERRLTVYDAKSEVSAINRAAGCGPVKVSRETLAILQHAVRLSQAMEGAFDITAGPLIDAWGFTTRQGRKPTGEEIEAAREQVGMKHLRLDEQRCTAELALPSMKINLGGIGKGDAIDRVAAQLRSTGVRDFLIHAGQSSVLASGDQFEQPTNQEASGSASEIPSDPAGEGTPDAVPGGWMVGIAHPTKPNRRIAGIWLRDAALATSGSGKQFFHHRGKRYGHVIDPRTGQPAGDLLSLSVLTERARDADALATGLFVMGGEKAQRFAESAGGLPLITVSAGRRQDDVTIHTVGQWDWADPPEGAKTEDETL